MEQNQGEKPQRAPDLRQMSGSAGESQSEVTSTPATHSSCKNVKPDYALKMDHILRDLNSLERQVKLCKAKSRKELEYLYIEEMLTVQLVELDKIDLAGNESAKRRRRRLVVKTNTIIALLESKVPEIEQPPQQSNQQPQPEKENRQPQSQSDQDQEERRQHLIQQQVEKIQEYMERLDSDNVEEEVAGEAVGDASTTPSTEPSTSATSPSDSGLRKPRKTREALWHDDFPFKFDKTSGNGTSHLNCVKAGEKSLKCPVRLKIDAAGNRVVTGIHNHTPPKGGEKKVKFYAAIRKAVQTERTDFISIYHRVAAEAEYADTAIEFPPRVVERSMHRWRAAVRKKGSGKVRNVDDYVKFFETRKGQALLEYDPPNNRKLSYKVIIEEVETKKGKKIFKHLALYDEQTLEDHEDCTILQDDATFLSRPKVHGVTQLFTIMARNYDKCFPCIWILMSSKTAHAYEACLTAVRDEIWPNLKPEEVIADFEEAMEIAWKKVYPGVKLTGCYFHFTQAILRNAIKKGAATHRNLQDHPEKHLIIRMVMALALLPQDTIEPTYEAIKKIARKKFGTFFNEFFKYFDEYWIKRRGVARFCVYGSLDKTNNEQESMHKVLNYLFRHRQPHPWMFIDILRVNNFNLRVERETLGTTKRRRKALTIFNEADLLRCWKLLQDKPKTFTPLMMVTKVAYSLKDKYIQLGKIYSITHFEDDNDQNDVENSSSGTLDAICVGEVAGTNNYNIRIDIRDIEGLFDSDGEDSFERDLRVEKENVDIPWRIPNYELLAGSEDNNEITSQVNCDKEPAVEQINETSSVDCEKCMDECPKAGE
ncbi:hypothetical protein QAD02_017131 [Eretmocerus hayati]|uniref:Uncharacterized protein n=1 Tax=Eretmocerus hayati TaxID=131215 RepID=A0ACC2PDG7_9HYME|nr:hypothetical protein QAD02_017131 [Eretmocerus hayati]